MKARLAVQKDGRMDYAFLLSAMPITIGRDAGNLVQLPHPEVSKRHAAVQMKDGGWTIEDLKSTNGVIVNGARVTAAALSHGDRIRIGPFELVFETVADNAEWVPTHVIDLSSKVNLNTMSGEPPPRPSPGDPTNRP